MEFDYDNKVILPVFPVNKTWVIFENKASHDVNVYIQNKTMV